MKITVRELNFLIKHIAKDKRVWVEVTDTCPICKDPISKLYPLVEIIEIQDDMIILNVDNSYDKSNLQDKK